MYNSMVSTKKLTFTNLKLLQILNYFYLVVHVPILGNTAVYIHIHISDIMIACTGTCV